MSSRPGRTIRRGSWGIPPAVLWIAIANVAVWLVLLAVPPLAARAWPWLALSTDGLLHARLWQVLTYQVLHHPGDVLGIVFNTYFVVIFGRALESRWGSRQFAAYYLGCGAAGGLIYVLLAAIYGGASLAGSTMPLLAMLLAYGLIWPEQRILILFVLPVPILPAVAIIAVLEIASHWNADIGIANLGLLASMLVGWLWLRYGWKAARLGRTPISISGWLKERKLARRRKSMRVVDSDFERWFEDDDKTRH